MTNEGIELQSKKYKVEEVINETSAELFRSIKDGHELTINNRIDNAGKSSLSITNNTTGKTRKNISPKTLMERLQDFKLTEVESQSSTSSFEEQTTEDFIRTFGSLVRFASETGNIESELVVIVDGKEHEVFDSVASKEGNLIIDEDTIYRLADIRKIEVYLEGSLVGVAQQYE